MSLTPVAAEVSTTSSPSTVRWLKLAPPSKVRRAILPSMSARSVSRHEYFCTPLTYTVRASPSKSTRSLFHAVGSMSSGTVAMGYQSWSCLPTTRVRSAAFTLSS